MMALIARFLPALASRGALIGLAVAFAVGAGAGGWATWKISQASEVGRLKHALASTRESWAASMEHVSDHYESLLGIERDKVTIVEVEKNVPDDPVCNVGPDERRMLNRAGGSDPAAAGGPAGPGATDAADAGGIPRAVEVWAHTDCRKRYRECAVKLRTALTVCGKGIKERP